MSYRWMMAAVYGLLATLLSFAAVEQMETTQAIEHTAVVQQGRMLSHLIFESMRAASRLQGRIQWAAERLGRLPSKPSVPSARELARVRALAGMTRVSGAGVVVILRDASRPAYPGEPAQWELVHNRYVLRVVDLLIQAGARAVAIDGQRYTAQTSIDCAGPTIRINGVPYGSPYRITAVGPPPSLLRALAHDPDIQGWAQLVVIRYDPQRAIVIAPYRGLVRYQLAKPVKIRGR
jgi:uncharacterized protein YlxW (UPF0749 family)